MKTISSLFVLCCVLLCCLFTLSNCGQEPSCDDVKTYKLVNLSSYVPYTGNDTLRFLRNSTDTQIFVGQGLERFYVSGGKNSNADCPEDHESAIIKFKNIKDAKILTIEFSYKASINSNSLGFNYIGKEYTQYAKGGTKLSELMVNNIVYSYVSYHSNSSDTNEYIAYCYPPENNNTGILKVKTTNETLTLIR